MVRGAYGSGDASLPMIDDDWHIKSITSEGEGKSDGATDAPRFRSAIFE